MSPLIRKEIRLLVPFFGIALLLAVLPSFVPRNSYVPGIEEIIFWAFAFGVMLLGLAPFGQEFSLGTFSSMLAQPCERRRLWRLKILFVAIAGLLVLVAFAFSIHARLETNLNETVKRIMAAHPQGGAEMLARKLLAEEFWSDFRASLLIFIAALTGGFWTTLLFRQTGAALWFVILIPGVLIVVVQGLLQSWPQIQNFAVASVLSCYSAAGFLWAWRMFANAQDSQWLGETVALLSLTSSKAQTDSALPRRKGVLRALIRKEIQSHQISLFVAFGLLVLHICTLVFRRYETLNRNSELRFAIGAIPFLWLFIPWLIGAVTVAEERKLGTMESQLCLPVTRRFQFATKLAIALFLGTVLGGIMPSLLEWIGARFHISSELIYLTGDPYSNFPGPDPHHIREFLDAYQGLILICIGAGFITMVSFFASTLSRNTLHALGGAVVLGFAFFALFVWVENGLSNGDYFLWKGPLILFIGVPVAVITVIFLSFSNYKRLHAGRNVWLRNLLILSATLAFTGIATAFIDQRPWELAIPREPLHGPRRLSGSVRPVVSAPSGKVLALLPDGRLWVATQYRWQKVGELELPLWPWPETDGSRNASVPVPTSGVFVGGSNWVVLAAHHDGGDVAALKSDGTLWNILSRTNGSRFKNWEDWLAQEPKPRRIGSDSDWKIVVSVQTGFLAVKTNGTLWGWGQNEGGGFGTNYPSFVDEPVRVGYDSDWETIFPDPSNAALFKKRDGSILTPEWTLANHDVKRVRVDGNGADWLAVGGVNECRLVIRRDGSLWARGFRSKRLFGVKNPGWNTWELARIGGDSDWVQASGFPPDMVAIKGGRLLKNSTTLFAESLGQPSGYSDWLAADIYWNQLVALAADGTLCLWQYSSSGGGSSQDLFAPTHRPLWSFNILTDSKN